MKKTISIILSFFLLLTCNTVTFASDSGSRLSNDASYLAHVAHITNVAEDGSTIVNDNNLNDHVSISTTTVTVVNDNQINLLIKLKLNADSLIFDARPIARTQSGKTVFYIGNSNSTQYEIANFAYVDDISVTNMFFVNESENESANTILKLYLKDLASDSQDFYLIEVFNLDLDLTNIINTLKIDFALGSWTARYFSPFKTEFRTEQSRTATDSRLGACEQTFWDSGYQVKHVIIWEMTADSTNFIVGGSAPQYYSVEVIAKAIICNGNPDMTGYGDSYLHVDAVRLDLVSPPDTAWKKLQIDGSVIHHGFGSGTLSADIGVSLGLLGATLSIPLTFTPSYTVDIKPDEQTFNNVSGSYHRCISTEMDSHFRLMFIGNHFDIEAELKDYANASQNNAVIQGRWYVDIINLFNMNMDYYVQDQDITVNIV